MLDASAKGRLFVPTGVRFKHGNLPRNRSLSNDQVALIKQKLKSGLFTVAEISLEMGISRYIISDIKRGRTYRG